LGSAISMKVFDMNAVTVSESEKRRLLESRRQAQNIASAVEKIEITISSLDATRVRFEEARSAAAAAMRVYQEALIVLGEDDDDDYATALEKKEKFDRIESEFLVTSEVYNAASNRLGWELKNSGVETA
jgi:hypothetical protein